METGVIRDDEPEYAGFLLVQEIPGPGYCGGYLILNRLSRPVEFHCTLPVCPDPAQRILYGTALERFLTTSHIARPLAEKSRKPVSAIFIEQSTLSDVAALTTIPVVQVLPQLADNLVQGPVSSGLDRNGGKGIRSADLNWIRCPGRAGETEKPVASIVEFFQAHFDLLEPFDRVREALRQAHPARAA
jgi:hypothetical protein